MSYLALDPGHTTGWAAFDDNGDIIKYGNASGKVALYTILQQYGKGEQLIVEDFRLLPNKAMAQSWSQLDTVRIIGAIEYFGWVTDTPITFQPPNIKPMAYKMSGMVVPKSKIDTHYADAYVHGVYYLIQSGKKSRLEFMAAEDR